MNAWPEHKASFNERFRVEFPNGEIARNYHYKLTRADGAILSGVTDHDGTIPIQQGLNMEAISIHIVGPASPGEIS